MADIKGVYKYGGDHDYSEDLDYSLSIFLKKHGWTRIASGAFSTVYKNKNKNYVMKINLSPDPSYEHYAKMAVKLKSKYVPKILTKELILKNGKKYYVYLIEKLKPINKDGLLYNAIEDVASNAQYSKKELKESNILKKYPGLYSLIIRLYKNKKKGSHFDIHSGNVMLRADGTPVITDPYS